LKIGLPKIRFTRKVLLISVGMLAVLAGSGAAALYAGAGDTLLKSEPVDSPIGAACTTIETVVLKTPAKRLWLRKFIRMDHVDGPERIKTALRVAGLLANANPVDLVQVSVLDASGPTLRAQMRGRAIGAEVVIALQPQYLPDMKEPFIVRYYEGMPSDDGIYYGERISLEVPEIQRLIKAMRSVPDKQDCTELPKPGDKEDARKPGDHIVSIEGEKPAGQEPATAQEEKKADAAKDTPAKEKSFLDSVLSMVGLGDSEEKSAEKHEAKTDALATDNPIDAAPAADENVEDKLLKSADHAAPRKVN
jgi:hypothetical protein